MGTILNYIEDTAYRLVLATMHSPFGGTMEWSDGGLYSQSLILRVTG